MAKAKRSPIDYTMRYANSFFRPREVVQREEEELTKQEQTNNPENQETDNSRFRETSNYRFLENSKSRNREIAKIPSNDSMQEYHFDLSAPTVESYGILFTREELEALEDMKKIFIRRYGIKTSIKNLVRLSVHEMIECFIRDGEESFAIRRVRSKK